MSDLGWLFIAFMAVWIVIGAYILSIAARQKRLDHRIQELESHHDRGRSHERNRIGSSPRARS